MNIVTVIQTRSRSSRLINKALLNLEGEPLFIRVYERVKAATLSGKTVIATTSLEEDDEICKQCSNRNIPFIRGPVEDLLRRHYLAARTFNADVVVKIPSDCPLIDPDVIDKVIGYYLKNSELYDYVSNLHPQSYPDGNDVEVFSMRALIKAMHEAGRQYEREHTTPYFWENPDKFRIGNVIWETGINLSLMLRFTVDYAEDYLFVAKVYKELYPVNPIFGLNEIIHLLANKPELQLLNERFRGVNWYRHHLNELKTISPSDTKLINE